MPHKSISTPGVEEGHLLERRLTDPPDAKLGQGRGCSAQVRANLVIAALSCARMRRLLKEELDTADPLQTLAEN